MMRNPPEPGGTGFPFLSTTSGRTPNMGRVQEPGLVGVIPGKGEIIIEPVSVCHQVSTIGHFPFPIIL